MSEIPQVPPRRRIIKFNGNPDFGGSNTYDFDKTVRSVAVQDEGDGILVVRPAFVTSPAAQGSKYHIGKVKRTDSDAETVNDGALKGISQLYGFNGTNWDRVRVAGAIARLGVTSAPFFATSVWLDNGVTSDKLQTGNVIGSVSGASPQTLFASAGPSLKRRLFDLHIGSSAAGVVVVSDSMGSYQVPAGGNAYIRFGPNGILQGTAATAITITLAAATLTATAVANAGE